MYSSDICEGKNESKKDRKIHTEEEKGRKGRKGMKRKQTGRIKDG
jgi:hypothetical protein